MDYRKAFDLIDDSLLIAKLKQYASIPIYNQLGLRLPYLYSECKDVMAGVPLGTKPWPWLLNHGPGFSK